MITNSSPRVDPASNADALLDTLAQLMNTAKQIADTGSSSQQKQPQSPKSPRPISPGSPGSPGPLAGMSPISPRTQFSSESDSETEKSNRPSIMSRINGKKSVFKRSPPSTSSSSSSGDESEMNDDLADSIVRGPARKKSLLTTKYRDKAIYYLHMILQ